MTAALHCAKEGYNIRVNSVHPGYILTPMLEQSFSEMADGAAFKKQIEKKHPVGHMGEPMDVAYGVLYLGNPSKGRGGLCYRQTIVRLLHRLRYDKRLKATAKDYIL